jgi:2-succinyl-5-enolpyruvyl-6-hydroxy-3-cyclohexene-1-carboxylate synthase
LLRQALRTWEFQHFHFGESDAEVFMRPVIKISALPAVSNEWRAQFDGIVAQSLAQARQAWKRANGLEFNVFQHILPTLMTPDELHLGNSLAVRLASFYPDLHPSVRTWSNRGTSGIDGCLSTAMGHAVGNPNATHVLILGDLSFLYDRNGLWRDPVPPNLKIVVLNNREGAIFRALDGPSHWPNSMHYWSTPHQRSAQLAAEEFGIEYHVARNSVENERAWQEIRCSDCACILEVFSDPTETANSYHSILAAMREGTSYEH